MKFIQWYHISAINTHIQVPQGEKQMTKQEIENVLAEINEYLETQLWMDFEIIEYSQYELKIIGSIDISSTPNIEIILKDVFFFSSVFNWKTDTSHKAISLIEGNEARKINIHFQVEQGYHLVKFKAEDYPDDIGCIFGVKEIRFKNVRYRENQWNEL